MAGALAGTTVLELTRVSPGSFCTMILADMGADVLKIETPPALSPESGSGISARTERQAAFSYVNRNKRSLGLNLKSPEGQAILHQLAAGADVLATSSAVPGKQRQQDADDPMHGSTAVIGNDVERNGRRTAHLTNEV